MGLRLCIGLRVEGCAPHSMPAAHPGWTRGAQACPSIAARAGRARSFRPGLGRISCNSPWADPSRAGTPKQRGTGGPRRRNGRWSEQETQTLIELVRRNGKGKWKKILEDGREIFVNRTQARAGILTRGPASYSMRSQACLQWRLAAAAPNRDGSEADTCFLPAKHKFNQQM